MSELSLHSTSVVTTEMASRYMQQLCKHFAHKVPAKSTPEKGSITFPFGTCVLGAEGKTLSMTVSAANAEDLEKMRMVIASHLERFAFRDNPAIIWN